MLLAMLPPKSLLVLMLAMLLSLSTYSTVHAAGHAATQITAGAHARHAVVAHLACTQAADAALLAQELHCGVLVGIFPLMMLKSRDGDASLLLGQQGLHNFELIWVHALQ